MSTPLTTTQEQVLAQLSAGATLTAAAESAGIHRNTIGYWRRSSTEFRSALDYANFEKAMYWREQAETLAAAAVEALRAVLADPEAPASVRVKAALSILDKACTPPPAEPEIMHKNAQKMDLTPVESTTVQVVHESAPAAKIEPTNPISTFIRSGPKIGRNDPCPCGSGKKFKHCCIDKIQDSAA